MNSSKNKDALLQEFLNGESLECLAKDNNMTWSSMYQIVGGRLPCNRTFSAEEENRIVQMYSSGMSSPKIGIEFKVSHKAINKVLDKNGIVRKFNGVRKWKLDEHYFDVIDNQNKAHILGFLYADGYNDVDKSTVRLQLRYDDKEILERIRKELKSDKPLNFINCSSKVAKNGYISNDMYSLEIYGKHICKSLIKHGMVKNKSLVLKFPDSIPYDLLRHFVRGYFDGDGSFIYSNANSAKRYQGLVTITSTDSFCESCLSYIRENTRIGGSIFDASCHNGITKVITIGGNKQCKVFLDWLYLDAELYLERKHDKYLSAYYSNAA